MNSIKTRCKVIFDQAELRELHFKSILRHKDAEIAHLQAKHEVERRKAESEAARCRTLTSQVNTFSHTEAELRSQLNIYVEKFKQVSLNILYPIPRCAEAETHSQQVEDTLNNSNELFMSFRKEMEDMSKKTKLLEKENQKLTRKHDAVRKNIITMAEERDRHMREIEKLKLADTKMRNIIKSMQQQGRSGPIQEDAEGETESEYDEYDEDEDEDGSYVEGDHDIDLPVDETRPPDELDPGPMPPPKTRAVQEVISERTPTLVNGTKH